MPLFVKQPSETPIKSKKRKIRKSQDIDLMIVASIEKYHIKQQGLHYRRATMSKKNNVDVEFDSDVGYPYHLQPDIIKMALFIHNATSEQKK